MVEVTGLESGRESEEGSDEKPKSSKKLTSILYPG